MMSLSGSTRIAGVVGNPVRHSKSPTLHNAALAHLGLDWAYGAFEVDGDRGPSIVAGMRTLGLAGLSVTMPFKQIVAETADQVTPAVERLGVANTLFWRDGEIVADSTDGDGFLASCQHRFGIGVEGISVAVIGAGGAGRSIVEALGRAGADDIVIVNRTESSAMAAADLAPTARAAVVDEVAECDLVVNATSVGMADGSDPASSPVPEHLFHPKQRVVDIVYQPAETPMMRVAAARGAEVDNGLGMLIHQAALQLELFTGRIAPVDVMRAAVA